ncbi:MAG: IS5 family transposase [Nitrosopumilus sp. (ex Thoosa mismalolli)]|nr:IS5 family transposase [Nitrosopumilus sp. (ex Thoosa mismalolli)]
MMLAVSEDLQWSRQLREANRRKKNGAPFKYAEALFVSLAITRSMMQIPYRQLAGMASEMMSDIPMPSHATIHRRIRNLRVQAIGSMVTVTAADGSKGIFYAVDSTGIKVDNLGEWIRKKWKARRGFVKMHILVDTDTGMIRALRVTDESVGDSKMFAQLLEEGMPDGGTGCLKTDCVPKEQEKEEQHQRISVLADGAYASRDIHKTCADCGATPLIRLKVSSTARGKGKGDAWGLAVRDQLGGSPTSPVGTLTKEQKAENQKKWKKRVRYGRRWTVEIVISAFKRIFGESVMATRWEDMVHEMTLKVATYNRITAIGGWN